MQYRRQRYHAVRKVAVMIIITGVRLLANSDRCVILFLNGWENYRNVRRLGVLRNDSRANAPFGLVDSKSSLRLRRRDFSWKYTEKCRRYSEMSSYLQKSARILSAPTRRDTCHRSLDRTVQKHAGFRASFRFVVAY